MTVKIIGHWERGWDTPWQEYNWWIHPLREFGIEEFNMIPITGIDRDPVKEYDDINEFLNLDENKDFVHVYLDEAAEDGNELNNFVHPENVIYIIGKCGTSPYKTNFRPSLDKCIKIPSVRNTGGFWGHQVASLLLYDRFLKDT